jgi:hypothetical protein
MEKPNKNEPMIQTPDEKGLQVEAELSRMLEVKKQWAFDELEEESNLIYEIIFDNYGDGEENGIATDRFTFLETESGSEVFNLIEK